MSETSKRQPKRLKRGDESSAPGDGEPYERLTREELEARLTAAEKRAEESEKRHAARDRIAKRRSLRTLVALDEGNIVLKLAGSDYSHNSGDYESATATERLFPISEINEERIALDFVSQFLLHLIDQKKDDPTGGHIYKKLEYTTEADIATMVLRILNDAIAILTILHPEMEDLSVFQERSLFSGRPDILAVRSARHDLPVLVVEVKKPTVSLCEQPIVLGQVFDYGEHQQACGHRLPIVVLTSMDETCVCWNDKFNDEVANLCKDDLCPPTPRSKKKQQQNSTSASPPQLETPNVFSVDDKDLGFFVTHERNLSRSRVFKAHELVNVLYTTLGLALKTTQMAKVKSVHNLQSNKTYRFPKVLRFVNGKPGYNWGRLVTHLGFTICSFVDTSREGKDRNEKCQRALPHDDKAYYLIGPLGRGDTANVWHAVDVHGVEVVVKMYVKNTDAEGNTLDSKDFVKQAEQATRKEVATLLDFYECLEGKVKHVVLSGFHCVVMPFFTPVATGEREATLDDVRDVLQKVFCEKRLKYRQEDVRWRHIGTYENEEEKCLILYDLADLERTQESDWVETHVKFLADRMATEKEHVETTFEHTSSPDSTTEEQFSEITRVAIVSSREGSD